jgi:hypothetical protein
MGIETLLFQLIEPAQTTGQTGQRSPTQQSIGIGHGLQALFYFSV